MKKNIKINHQKNYKILPLGSNSFKIIATMEPCNNEKMIFSIFDTHKKIILAKNGDLNSHAMFLNLQCLMTSLSFII